MAICEICGYVCPSLRLGVSAVRKQSFEVLMEDKNGYKCPLCSFSFKVGEAKCGACPMSKGCKIICCPHCGYQWVEESKAVNLIKKIMGKK